MFNVKVVDVSMYAPSNVVSNDDLSKFIDTSDEWIYSRTGIKSRHISLGENTSDLAYEACKNMDLDGLDLIIVATFTPDKFSPATASILQSKLGIENCSCMDLNAGCTGYIYALKVAAAMISAKMHKKVLVVGSEVISKAVDWDDRSTCVLFGDGAGAFLLEADEQKKMYSFYTNAIDDKDDALYVPGVSLCNYAVCKAKENQVITMDGSKVFKFAVNAISDAINQVLASSNLTIDDIALIFPHQANERIIKSVSKGLNIPLNKFYVNIGSYGNTSSASIPIAFAEALENGKIKRGDKVLLVGFGAGLTWGSTIFEF